MAKDTPLRKHHEAAGARLVEFAGWSLPIQYDGIQAEHRRVRESAGLFDVSHMGRLYVSGPQALQFMDGLLPAAASRLAPGRMAYTVLCDEQGHSLDDLAVYRLGDSEFLLVVNAARLAVDLDWLRARRAAAGLQGQVEIDDRTESQGMIALQGPQAAKLAVARYGAEVGELGFFRFLQPASGSGRSLLVSRSGYTGEDGFEIICDAGEAGGLWADLVGAGAGPAGLAARDTLRLEAGLCLYGHELTESTTPLEAGLGWTLSLDKEADFPGKEALRRQHQHGVERQLVGLCLTTRGIPRAGQQVELDGRPVGEVTSGSHSPVLGKGIAMAYVQVDCAEAGQALDIVVRRKRLSAEVVTLPFVPSRIKRRRRNKKNA